MSRGRSGSSWHIAKIFRDITWDAGLTFQSAFRTLHKPRKKKPRKPTEYVRFIYKGQYYRRPIASNKKKKAKPPELMKLPPAGPQVLPMPFKTPPPKVGVAQKAEALVAATTAGGGNGGGGSQGGKTTWSWRSWWKLNAPLVILNFGSMATLVGFTRGDVLELRSLAMTGNTTFVIYSLLQPPPIRWPAIIWSCLFASVNGFNIAKILSERNGKVYRAPHEEKIYHEHFEPHGVTPKQFEKVMSTGKRQVIKKGDVISRQGVEMSTVKLVVHGNTRANVKGRHLTAMGSARGNRYAMQGGDSGAWVGEMAFLQSLWDRDHAPKKSSLQKRLSGEKPNRSQEDAKTGPVPGSTDAMVVRSGLPPSDKPYTYCAISTIVAVEDIELIEWTFEEMEKLMKSSRDIKDSLTRAMTAAIVGKVVNFMVSRQSAIPKWSTMLDNWRHASPRDDEDDVASESEDDEESSLQAQPIATSAAQIWRKATQGMSA